MAIYSDINQHSPTSTALLTDLNAIYQSIGNILSTPKNTRLFRPDFGSSIENLLFEPMDDETVSSLYDTIILAIQEWEPRVILDYSKSNIIPNYDTHTYYVELTFRVRGLNDNNFYTYAGTLYQRSK